MRSDVVYLDHNATTPLDERVLQAMLPYLSDNFGNPSSVYALGREARAALDRAREQVASAVNCHPGEVVFTSGGTEANNAALQGYARRTPSGHLAISAIEHASVTEVAESIAHHGWRVEHIAVDGNGQISADAVEKACKNGANLISVMWANNETGTIQDLFGLSRITEEFGVVLHTDAVQALGKIPVDFRASGAQMMSLSAHKIYGPKGVGALIVDKCIDLEPLLQGGGQEKGRRCGTENLAGIVGFGRAAELAVIEFEQRNHHVQNLRASCEKALADAIPDVVIFAQKAERLPNTLFFAIPGIDGETLISALDRKTIAVSSGSACGSSHTEPSPVLKAMGIDNEIAIGAIRVSFGKNNTQGEVDFLVKALAEQVKQFRSMAVLAWT